MQLFAAGKTAAKSICKDFIEITLIPLLNKIYSNKIYYDASYKTI